MPHFGDKTANGLQQTFTRQGRIRCQVAFFVAGLVRINGELVHPPERIHLRAAISEQHQQAIDLVGERIVLSGPAAPYATWHWLI